MRINYYKINPGGNITAIVDTSVRPPERINIAKRILSADPTVEQVGFWLKSRNKECLARLEMAGGEFSGNGARALGYLIWKKTKKTNFYIESSGLPNKLPVKAYKNYVSIFLPQKFFSSRKIPEGDIIYLPGISFIVSTNQSKKIRSLFLLKKYNLVSQAAAGLVVLQKKKGKLAIKPIVWVRDTKTLYQETACASGTMAAAYVQNKKWLKKQLAIKQPSGDIYTIEFDRKSMALGGEIK